MAGVSTKDIKQRIRSMESTRQITRAMEMVAASKLRHAQDRIRDSRSLLRDPLWNHCPHRLHRPDFSSPLSHPAGGEAGLRIVIAGDRGLAGGYNNNMFKLVQQELGEKELSVLPMGKRAVEHFRGRGVPLVTQAYSEAADVTIGDCFSLSKQLAKAYLAGEFDEISVAFTNFVSVLSQTPAILPLLPLSHTAASRQEPDPQTVFDAIIPEYLGGVVYGAL